MINNIHGRTAAVLYSLQRRGPVSAMWKHAEEGLYPDNMRRLGRRRLESVTVAVGLMTFNDVGPTLFYEIKKLELHLGSMTLAQSWTDILKKTETGNGRHQTLGQRDAN